MTLDITTLAAILVMALAAALCRFLGYGFMRFIPVTPRLEAGLQAVPLAIMIGIIVPPVLRGGVPEFAGVVATIVAAYLKLTDLVAILVGMGVVAALRAVS
jgi:uncharacterized membrane protein